MHVVQTSAHPFQPTSLASGIPTKQESRESHPSSARLAPIRRALFAFLAAKASLALPFQRPKDDWGLLAIVLRRGLGAKRQGVRLPRRGCDGALHRMGPSPISLLDRKLAARNPA